MTNATITCPHCGRDIPLTETLAQPLIEATRRKYEAEARARDEALARREAELRRSQEAVAREKAEFDAVLAERLKTERAAIIRQESARAAQSSAGEIELLRRQFQEKSAQLAEAQKTELLLRQERQALAEARERLELDKQRAVDEARAKIREATLKDAAEQYRLREAEKDKIIADLRGRADEMQRKLDQGSQQLQGEVQELDLEAALRSAFPHDTIEPVPKGVHGGDVVHRVRDMGGREAGVILWESKRTKQWSDAWLAKLRGDQREARADLAVIASLTLPRGVESFEQIDRVWVVSARLAIPLATALRQGLIETAAARSAADGQQSKTALVYQYLTGPGFRQRIEAIREAFDAMSADLEQERRAIMKQWAKRQAQIDAVLAATVGMYGDLQGIAGKSMPEISGLEFKALEGAR